MIWESCWNIYIGKVFSALFKPPKAACCKVAVGEHLQHCPAVPSRNWCFGDAVEVVSGGDMEVLLFIQNDNCLGCSINQFFWHHSGSIPDQTVGVEKLIVQKKVYQHWNQPVWDASSLIHQFRHTCFHTLFFFDFPDDDTVVGRKADKKLSATNVPQTQRVKLIIESIISTSKSLNLKLSGSFRV